MAELLNAKGLVKAFGPIKAVDGVDLAVGAGTVLGFLGPNGAGKTTTMRLITGFLAADAGSVTLNGHALDADPLLARAQVGYLPEGAPAYPDMRVGEFLRFVARARGLAGRAARGAIDLAVARLQLEEVWRQPIETLSKGFKRRVGFAQAILHDPPVLILDEPTDGLDPNQKHQVRTLIRDMGAAGNKAIILSTHILEEVEAVCTRAVVIDHGRVVFDGTPPDLERKAPADITRHRLDHVFRMLTTGRRATAEVAS